MIDKIYSGSYRNGRIPINDELDFEE